MSDKKELTGLAKAVAERKRNLHEFDVGKHLGFGKEVHKVKIRVPTKREQDLALANAHQYVAKLAEKSPNINNDDEVLRDSKAAAIVCAACRDADQPEKFPAWPTTEFVHDNLTADQVGALLQLVNSVRAKEAPFDTEIDDERVEAYIKMAVNNSSSDIPDATLAMLPMSYMTQLYILTALKLNEAREELTRLIAQNEMLTTDAS